MAQHTEQSAKLWSAFMAALAEAEGVAREVVEIRSEAQATIAALSQLRKEYGLDVEVPRELKPTTAESKIAGLLGSLLRDVAHYQVIDRLLDVELASAIKQVKREAA